MAYQQTPMNPRHQFECGDGAIDLLLPNSSDTLPLEEEKHWDTVANRGGNIIRPNAFINRKIIEDCRRIYCAGITSCFPNYRQMNVTLGEIGADVSLNALKLGVAGKSPPHWGRQYLRASANSKIITDDCLDIMFCAAALHHLDVRRVMNWVSSSIKHGGLLILHEPNLTIPLLRLVAG